jgi:hypothetical protein
VTTTPPGLNIVSLTYDGSPTPPSNVGTYAVVASLANSNYQAADANGVLSIVLAFTDVPIQPGQTVAMAAHILELRSRVNALRARFGLPPLGWTDGSLSGHVITTIHITELRDALNAAYVNHGMSAPTYADPVLIAGSTPIKAVHVNELRAAVVALENSP